MKITENGWGQHQNSGRTGRDPVENRYLQFTILQYLIEPMIII